VRAKREQAIHYLGAARAPARVFALAPARSTTRSQADAAARSGTLRRFGRSLEHRLVDCLSRRVVGDLCLMVEALLVGLSGLACHVAYDTYYLGLQPNHVAYIYLGLFAASLFFLITFAVFRLKYRHLVQFRLALGKTLLALLLSVMCVLLLAFITATTQTFSRASFLAWTGSSALLLLATNYLFACHVAKASWLKRCVKREGVVIGTTELVARFLHHLQQSGERDLQLLGIFVERRDAARWRSTSDFLGVPYGGDLDDLVERVLEGEIDEVLVALPWHEEQRITRIVDRLSDLAVDVKLCPDRVGYVQHPVYIERIGGALVTAVQARPIRDWSLLFKSILDVVLSALLLAALAPLFVAIAILIRLDSPGPVLFRQKRQGFSRDVFEIYKFRTMVHAPGSAFVQARQGDPRITRVGRRLRRLSLDELPQLINVLQGEMSLVGPRPHPSTLNLEFMDQIKRYATRHRVKPGITGLAQINGWRGPTDTAAKMAGRVSHDLYYIEHWSLLLDLKILALTLLTGFGRKNAH
jgi:Undecaprenyl-phosphate glucose phosphotransferase